ncbi:MAG: DUF438 domain-containing protein, partial [Deltaproteobacteria bacterium]|nr:DUF438 domain-containing protein [Deltaproteobacteria bacterium]
MKISAKTKIDELLKEHKFLEEFLVKYNPKFSMLKNRVARATVGKMANMKAVASIGGVAVKDLLRDIAGEVERVTGRRPETEGGGDKAERVEELKGVITALHDGASVDDVRAKFAEVIAGASGPEIAEMEQQLIADGLAVEEVQRLCDVHVGAFKQTLDDQEEVEAPPGHPVHTYMKANEKIAELANKLASVTRDLSSAAGGASKDALEQARSLVEDLSGVDLHYTRKENQLFPFLEKHGISGPSKVMWGVHDEIRGALKNAGEATTKGDVTKLAKVGPRLARDLAEMIYKENKILFPMAMQALTPNEWNEVRKGEDELGYAFAEPEGEGPARGDTAAGGDGELKMATGGLTLEQVNMMFTALPVDISFVDENDEVRFYSEGERHFPRSPAVIGRKVQNCHPPKSMDTVQKILDAFRAGDKDVAEFWIKARSKFLHIRYFAMRDGDGTYRGCLEVGQEVTEIRKLKGEQRLLDW